MNRLEKFVNTNSKKRKILLFDFDGVIVDTFEMCYQIQKRFEGGVSKREYRDKFKANINKDERFLKLKRSEQLKEDIDYFSLYTPLLLKQKIVKGMEKVIKELAKNHLLLIVSSTDSRPIKIFLKRYNLLRYFDDIYGNDVNYSKIAKIRMVKSRYHSNSDGYLFITDTTGDIHEARKCGIKSTAVTWGYHHLATLKEARPLSIVRTPTQLLKTLQS